jgi:hypothetical protein
LSYQQEFLTREYLATIKLDFDSLRDLSRDKLKLILKAQFNWSDGAIAEFDDPYQSAEEIIEYLLDRDADEPEDCEDDDNRRSAPALHQ